MWCGFQLKKLIVGIFQRGLSSPTSCQRPMRRCPFHLLSGCSSCTAGWTESRRPMAGHSVSIKPSKGCFSLRSRVSCDSSRLPPRSRGSSRSPFAPHRRTPVRASDTFAKICRCFDINPQGIQGCTGFSFNSLAFGGLGLSLEASSTTGYYVLVG